MPIKFEIMAAMNNNSKIADLRIAVVDDEPDLPALYSQVIEKLGYPSPSLFNDGTSIVKALTKDRQSFDIIIMDYRMPEMNGIEAANIIVRYKKNTKIILVSAYDFVKQKAAEAGFPFLMKPFSIQQLGECIESMKN